jgi:prepilin-type N-terminal cleavage/methylation domain-containing protein
LKRPSRTESAGFTLVEVAVTLLIVGIGLTLCLQSLFTAKATAAHTRNLKLARELGVQTLGQVESGLFQDEIRSDYYGTYAQEGYEAFSFVIMLGDDAFAEYDEYDSDSMYHDTFAARRDREWEARRDAGEDEDDFEEPFEKVKVQITFPKTGEYNNQLVLENWMPWKQVYGEDEEEAAREENSGP